MQKIQTALVGYGYSGKTFHTPLIQACKQLNLHTVVTSQQEIPLLPHAVIETSFDNMLHNNEISLVVLATPNTLHFPQAKAAILAGKHVVVDKPFAITVNEAKELAMLSKEKGCLLSVFHNRRYDADFLTLKKLLNEGTFGKISHFESHFDRFRLEPKKRWREENQPGSGLWYDLGPHLVDQMVQLFGPPKGIHATIQTQREHAKTDDYFHVVCTYETFTVILHASCLVSGASPRFIVHGTKGSYVKTGLDTQESHLKEKLCIKSHDHYGRDPVKGLLYKEDETLLVQQETGNYRLYFEQIARAILNNEPNPVPPGDAITTMEILEMASQSRS